MNNFNENTGITLHTASADPGCVQFAIKLEGTNTLTSISNGYKTYVDENYESHALTTSLYICGDGSLDIPSLGGFSEYYIIGDATVNTTKAGNDTVYVAKDATYNISESGANDYELDLSANYYIAGTMNYSTSNISNVGIRILSNLNIANTGKVTITPISECEYISIRTSTPGKYSVTTLSGESLLLYDPYSWTSDTDPTKNYHVGQSDPTNVDMDGNPYISDYRSPVILTGNDTLPSMEPQLVYHQIANVTAKDATIASKSTAQTYTISYSCPASIYKFKATTGTITKTGKLTIPKNFVGTISIHAISKSTDKYYSNASTGAPTCTITVKPVKPAATSISKLTSKSKTITATWKKVSAASGYQLQYSTSSKMTGAKTVKITSNKASGTIKNLTKNKKYYVRVRAYTAINGYNPYYSSWSAVKAIKVK